MRPERKAEIKALTFERKRAFWETAIPKEDRRERILPTIIADMAEAAPEMLDRIEELEAALQKSCDFIAAKIVEDLDCACPHDKDGNIIRAKIDKVSEPYIVKDEKFLATIRAVLEGKP